jgi:serine/threonine-protein kinase
MFTLLTGRFVHEADTVNEQLLSAMTRVAPKVSSLAPEIPREVAEVVDRALAFRKDARWEDARAMKGAIRRAYKAMRGDAASNLPIAPRSSHVDKREVVTVVAGDSANDGRDVSEAGVVAAPSAAPFADTLASARVPNRRPLILGLLAAGMGAAIAFSAFTRHPMPTPIASASAGVGDAVAITLPAADDPHLTFPTEEALAAPVEVAAGDAGRPTVSTSLALRTGRPASGGREGAAAETPSVSGPLAPKNSPDLLDRRR